MRLRNKAWGQRNTRTLAKDERKRDRAETKDGDGGRDREKEKQTETRKSHLFTDSMFIEHLARAGGRSARHRSTSRYKTGRRQ